MRIKFITRCIHKTSFIVDEFYKMSEQVLKEYSNEDKYDKQFEKSLHRIRFCPEHFLQRRTYTEIKLFRLRKNQKM